MPDSTIIDPQAIENLRALDPDGKDAFLREIIGVFLEDTPQRLAELDSTLAAGDVLAFTRAAHSVKGSSSNLGANVLRAAAEKLEHQARTHGLGDVTGLLAQVRSEYARAQEALAALLQA